MKKFKITELYEKHGITFLKVSLISAFVVSNKILTFAASFYWHYLGCIVSVEEWDASLASHRYVVGKGKNILTVSPEIMGILWSMPKLNKR